MQVTTDCIRLGGVFSEEIDLQRIFTADLLDIFPTESGFVYACRETVRETEQAAAFYCYRQEADVFEKLSVNAYIAEKFGENGALIARTLRNFITCRARPLTSSTLAVAFPEGALRLVGSFGEIVDEATVEYLSRPARSPALNGMDLWYAVPDANAIINYSVRHKRIEFRIGSPKDKTFRHPVDLSIYDNKLFVCNETAYCIKTIDLDHYQVTDHVFFKEPVTRYFRSGETEYVVLSSGVYSL